MIGRNKNWSGPSPWMDEFNKVHNPDYYYGKNKKKAYGKNKKKTKEKKTSKKKASRTESTERYPVFKVED